MKSIRQALESVLLVSFTSDQIRRIGADMDEKFDLYQASGFGPNIRIPNKVAVDCLLDHFREEKQLIALITHLIQNEGKSTGGSAMQLRGKAELLAVLAGNSYVYDDEYGQFVKDQRLRATPDWGFMIDGKDYHLTIASIDLAGSSSFSAEGNIEAAQKAMTAFRDYVRQNVELWNGRIWRWSGDGGVAVFYGMDAVNRCVIAMSACLLNFPVFVVRRTRLPDSVEPGLRIGIHQGIAAYRKDVQTIFSEDIRLAMEIEQKYCPLNSIAVTPGIKSMLRGETAQRFDPAPLPGFPLPVHVMREI